ncbi:hypothetical protein C8R46DRAFT_10843 [Mycena filopes]|nr:hypothetical protein C8R46DRAFT_10843 [Mycena filopes]
MNSPGQKQSTLNTLADEVEFMDDLQEIVPFNWKAELTRIIMTHSSLESTSPTLKLLVGVTLPAPEFAEKYSDAVTRVFELVASTSQHKDYELALPDLCRHLTSMLAMLNSTELVGDQPVAGSHVNQSQVHELAALLNLLTCLSCSLPNFAPSLLALSQGNGDDYGIIETLCSIVRDHLEPTKQQTVLGGETVGLLEGLCWNLKEDLTSRLAVFCKSKDILMILLDTSQPSPLLRRTTQLIALLATHPQLSHDLLSSSDQRPPPSDGTKAKDTAKVPHIERLCSLLIDTSRTDPDAVEMKSQILTFFGILSVAHPDVHALLVGCQGLVPSLVVFLTQMASILWEGDEVFTMSAEAIDRIIRTLNQTLFLVHHLVFGIEPNFNLRHRLHYAPSRAFSGITHMFIVTFGRLAYADAPEWIESAQKLELESMSEMAQSLLNFVVDGPEGDGIWTAYQVDSGDASDTDEEDMEAKLLGT